MATPMLEKLAKILNQAENAGTPEEAETFMEAAVRLTRGDSILLAKARHLTKDKQKTVPVQRTVVIGLARDKGLATLVDLYLGIAAANDIKCAIARNKVHVYAYGFAEDLDVAEALFASLQVQQAKFVAEYKASGEWKNDTVYRDGRYAWAHPETGKVTKVARKVRSYTYDDFTAYDKDGTELAYEWLSGSYVPISWLTARINFQDGFASRLRHRLAEAAWNERQARIQAEEEEVQSEDTGTALVLAEKAKTVEDFYYERNPHFKKKRHRSYNDGSKNRQQSYSARSAGRAAGDRARIGNQAAFGNAKGAIGA